MRQIFSLSACLVDEQWRGKNNHVANGPSLSLSLSSLRFPLSYPLPHSRLLPLTPGDTLPLLLPSPSLFPFLTHPLFLFLSFPFLSLPPYSDFSLSFSFCCFFWHIINEVEKEFELAYFYFLVLTLIVPHINTQSTLWIHSNDIQGVW